MDDAALLAALRRESDALSAAARGHLGAPIPAVEDWTVGEVVAHVGQGAQWAVHLVRDAMDATAALLALPPDPDADALGEEGLLEWFDARTDELCATLEAAGPDAPCWTFAGPGPARAWWRRRAHETAIHRWDVAGAAGAPSPVDRDLALDGIDEVFELFVPRLGDRLAGDGRSLHLHATDDGRPDGAGEWTITFSTDGPTAERGHAKGDAAVRGSASDLLLLLWNRVPASRLEVFGDATVLDFWAERARI
ncbi:MAG TPA: maleylpyruvate isomerase family mycothiol-dependent enzyme [Acidimicrobiales bacterium]|nr:maleylpyruvate isomerase family mycothiol-dependent enzyme [Acidimicrobiales bacterium]